MNELKGLLKETDASFALVDAKIRSLNSKMARMSNEISDLHENTSEAAKARKNISLALIEIEKTYEHFRVPEEVRRDLNNISSTTTSSSSSKRFDYLDAMEQIIIARAFFEEHKEIRSSASVIERIDSTVSIIVARCASEVEKCLIDVGACVRISEGDEMSAVNPMEADDIAHLHNLLHCLKMDRNNNPAETLQLYAKCRIRALSGMLDREMRRRGNSFHASTSASSSYGKGSHPFFRYLRLVVVGLRGEIMLWSTVLKASVWGATDGASGSALRQKGGGGGGGGVTGTGNAADTYVRICDGILRRMELFLTPFFSTNVSSPSAQGNMEQGGSNVLRLGNTLMGALDVMGHLRANFDKVHDLCLPDSRATTIATDRLEAIRRMCAEACVTSVPALLRTISCTAASAAGSPEDDFIDMRPVTGHVLACARRLKNFEVEYDAVIGEAMSWAAQKGGRVAHDVPRSGELLILNIVTTLLQSLLVRNRPDVEPNAQGSAMSMMNPAASVRVLQSAAASSLRTGVAWASESLAALSKKTALYESDEFGAHEALRQAEIHLFMLNNLAPVMSAVNDTGADEKDHRCPEMTSFIRDLKERLSTEQVNFCAVLIRAMGMSEEQLQELAAAGDQRASGASKGRALKAKFAQFNCATEAILSKKSHWRINDPAVRTSTTVVLDRIVVTAYRNFHGQYASVPFSTKHKDQYLRYEPDAIAGLFRSFFT